MNRHLQKQGIIWTILILKVEKKVRVFFLFAMDVVAFISLSSGVLLLNLPKLSNQYE